MRRYLWATLGLAAVAPLISAGFVMVQLSRNLTQAEAASRQRMRDLAQYIVENLHEDIFSYTFVLTPRNLPKDFVQEKGAWLHRLAAATGLQRVALTDSLGDVYIATTPSLATGADIRPYLLDSVGYDQALRMRLPVFARAAHSASRQSLYFPFDFYGTEQVVVLESDRNLLSQFESSRRITYGLAACLLVSLLALIAALLALDRRAQAALAAARRHEQLAFLGRTSAELAHELKNPLAVIKSSIDVLRRRLDPQGQNAAFQFLSDETMRLSRIITNILSFSHDRRLGTQPLPLAQTVAAAGVTLRAAHPGVEVVCKSSLDAEVAADPDAARQVLENIFHNAAQAMQGSGCIFLHAESPRPGRLRLLIADQGPGVPKALRKTLFDPFVTGSRTGAGLGLAIVKTLCGRMGWQVGLWTPARARRSFPGEKIGACVALEFATTGEPPGKENG